MAMTQARKPAQPVLHDVADIDDDSLYETRMPSSARRYKAYDTANDPAVKPGALLPRRASRHITRVPGLASNAVVPSRLAARPASVSLGKRFPLVELLVGMVITIVLIMTFSALLSWWSGFQDDLHYGRPRIAQLDAVVGHEDSASHPTHFIFLNLRGHIQVIEIPGGDSAHTHIFNGPTLFGDGQDLVPVTGEIRHEYGRTDLIVHIQRQQVVFINDGTTFHPQ